MLLLRANSVSCHRLTSLVRFTHAVSVERGTLSALAALRPELASVMTWPSKSATIRSQLSNWTV
ncbi:hypothetical protein DB30_08001 [Enhygromyxa salina]|uniref:Uncharacterized protein n=1 Tax=Enhygromyxa salina TaxID=215803 RepID=A0A0C1Z773_9BACT|nr:hypothetical protein DB30_08001 [Enhygromyxa salina]